MNTTTEKQMSSATDTIGTTSTSSPISNDEKRNPFGDNVEVVPALSTRHHSFAVEFEGEEIEPWPDPVNGSVLLTELETAIKRFVVLPTWAGETLALWILHTYAFKLRDVSTYLGIESPEKRCGKTTLLSVLSELVHRPVVAANISSPAFFRVIQQTQPTLMIDEADTFLQGNDELRGILNSGYTRKTAFVLRVHNHKSNANPMRSERSGILSLSLSSRGREGNPTRRAQRAEPLPLVPPSPPLELRANASVKEQNPTVVGGRRPTSEHHTPTADYRASSIEDPGSSTQKIIKYSCWCPKVVAAIGKLPDTLADRCIVIRMQRKTSHEECERLRGFDGADLKRKCARFIADNAQNIATASPDVPGSLNDRAADIWEPLLALADLAGGDWPVKSRQAAEGLTIGAQEANPIASLLLDLFFLFARTPGHKLFTREIITSLNLWGARPWADSRNGRPVTDIWLSQQLRPYGVKPRNIWKDGQQAKGFDMNDLTEVFRRYIPKSDVEALLNEISERHIKPDAKAPQDT